MTEWSDISTAPKDGTRIFVYGVHSSLYSALGPAPYEPAWVRSAAYWDGHEWVMCLPDETPTVGVFEDEWDGHQAAGIVAHMWMPLPMPPEDLA